MASTRKNASEEKKIENINSAATNASAPVSLARNLRSTLFSPQTTLRTSAFTSLSNDLLQLLASYLEDEDKAYIKLAQTSKHAYQALYPVIKASLVKTLKVLVAEDDTAEVEKLLSCHPYLQLRKEEEDPEGSAYQGIETTPYQDALADPMAEEMRAVLEKGFPGATEEERLSYAAMQSEEFKDPCFNRLREEKQRIRERTGFAYDAWQRRYQVWQANDYADSYFQPLCDAWMRVGLIQKKWPKRLRKIFSVVEMDEKQTFKTLQRDLPEPHFYGDKTDLWTSNKIGCDLRLMTVPIEQDLEAVDFRNDLRKTSAGQPMLIRQGEGAFAAYYLYAPHIPLDRDESEWRLVPIDDPNRIQLIRTGRSAPGADAQAVDFNQSHHQYSPLFEDLYQFAYLSSLYLGSGYPEIFTAYNCRSEGRPVAGRMVDMVLRGKDVRPVLGVRSMVAGAAEAIARLFEMRTERLAKHRAELEAYLPREIPSLSRN